MNVAWQALKTTCRWWVNSPARRPAFLFCLFNFLLASSNLAQEIEVRHFTVNDGLSGRRVRDLAFDHQGILWIGVDNGLNRYDGHGFALFDSDKSRQPRLGDAGVVNCHFIPREKKLLLCYGNTRFFERFDPLTGQVSRLPLGGETGFRGTFSHISAFQGERMFFGASDSSHFYVQELRDGRFTLRNQVPLREQVHHFFWSDTLLWLTLSNRLMVVERNSGNCHTIFFEDLFGRLPTAGEGLNPAFFYRDRQGRLLVSFVFIPGLYQYLGDGRLKIVEDFPKTWIYSHLSRDSFENELMFYKTGSLEDQVWVRLTSGTGPKQKIFSTQVIPLPFHASVQGNRYDEQIWVSAYDGFLLLRPRKVKTYLEKAKKVSSIRGMTALDARQMLIAVENSHWMLLDRQRDTLFPYLLKEERSGKPRPFGTCGRLIFDRRGVLWGTNAQELIRIDTARRVYRRFEVKGAVEAIDLDPETGDIWVVTWSLQHAGLYRFDPVKEQFFLYRNADGANPLKGRLSNELYFSPHQPGILWVATEKGIIRVDIRRRQSSELLEEMDEQARPIGKMPYVLALKEGPDALLWVGTYGMGLWCVDLKKKTWQQWRRAQGLTDDHVCSLEFNRMGNIWIGTFNGLSFFQPQSQLFRNFNREEGLSHPEFNRFASCRTAEGRFYFGGMNGVNAFFQEDLLSPTRGFSAPVLTKSIFWNPGKKELDTLHFISGRKPGILIPTSNRYLELQFALPNTLGIADQQFTYLLEKFDENWRPLSDGGKLVFQHLPSGNYRLLVRGATLQGAWSPSLELNIKVKEYFYKNPLFYLLCLLIAAAIGYWWQHTRSRQSLRLANMRIDLAGDLHDEIGSSMVYLSQLVEQVKDAGQAQRTALLGQIQETLQESISFIRDVVWAIDSRYDRAENLLDRMEDFLYHMLAPAGVHYHFRREDAPNELSLAPMVRQQLYLFFREAVTNIVKHAEASEVVVSFSFDRSSRRLHLYVTDNGRGIHTCTGTGNGLESMRRRSNKLNGTLELRPGPSGKGLEVHLCFPLQTKKLKKKGPA